MKVGIDIGASTIKIGSLNLKTKAGHFKKLGQYFILTGIPTDDDFRKTGQSVARLIKEIFGQPEKVVVGCFGPLELKKKKILKAPNRSSWSGADFHLWEDYLGAEILLENDANLAIYGEAKVGAGKGFGIVSGFTLGSGIGYGLIINGHIYHGNWDVEAGHMILDPQGPLCGCGQRGCLEAYISAKAIKQRFGQEPAQLENEKAWDWIVSKIAQGIQIITTVTKPDLFVLTGGIARRKGLLQKVQKHYQTLLRIYPKEATKTKIILGKYIEHAGVIGAIELPF